MNRNRMQPKEPGEFEEKVVQVNRVSKKTKGGNKIGFSVLVVVGDRNGKVGVGLGKGPDVLSSIKKATKRARKRMITLPLVKGTIPFPIEIKHGAAQLLLKPAPPGTGVIAGGAVRSVVEAAGVNNIVSKILGTNNKASNVYATFEALQRIKKIAEIKNVKLEDSIRQKTDKSEKSDESGKAKKTKSKSKAGKKSKSKPASKSSTASKTKKTSQKQTKKKTTKKTATKAKTAKSSKKKSTKKTAEKK